MKWRSSKEAKRRRGEVPHVFRFLRLSATPPLRHSSKGFTLLELVIYIGIVGVVLTTATLFAYEFVSSQAKSAALEEVNRNARYAIARIGVEIREASGLNTGASVFGSNPGTLSLSNANGANDPTIFSVTGTTLNVKRGAGADLPITNSKVDVTEFTLEDLSVSGKTKAVRVHIKVRSRNPDSLQEVSAETVIETTAKIKKNDGFSN